MVTAATAVFGIVWFLGWAFIAVRDWRASQRDTAAMQARIMSRYCDRVTMTRRQRIAENEWRGGAALR